MKTDVEKPKMKTDDELPKVKTDDELPKVKMDDSEPMVETAMVVTIDLEEVKTELREQSEVSQRPHERQLDIDRQARAEPDTDKWAVQDEKSQSLIEADSKSHSQEQAVVIQQNFVAEYEALRTQNFVAECGALEMHDVARALDVQKALHMQIGDQKALHMQIAVRSSLDGDCYYHDWALQHAILEDHRHDEPA